jgi:hypothetical protein
LEAKERLKLDINSATHLAFWHEKKGCCGMGLLKVTRETKYFYLTPRVYQVLMAASQSYFCLTDFYNAITTAKTKPIGFGIWNRLFNNHTAKSTLQIEKMNFQQVDQERNRQPVP